MPCRIINSPLTGEQVTSQTWNDLYNLSNSEQEADKSYEQMLTPAFLDWFGDWTVNASDPSKSVNSIGEPSVKELDTFLAIQPTTVYYQADLPEEEVIRRTIEGFNLKEIKRYSEKGYITKEDRQNEALIDKIKKFVQDKFPGTAVLPVLDKTYNLIKFFRDTRGELFQLEIPPKASPKATELIKDFLKQIGVDVKAVASIPVQGTNLTANGIAIPSEKLIKYVSGKEDTVLPEEAMHIAVEIVEQLNPTLFNEMLSNIHKHPVYRSIFDTYSKIYTKDGKPDIRKIKKEAIARVLVDTIIDKVDPNEKTSGIVTWWEKVVTWLKTLFSKSKNAFDTIAEQVIDGKFEGNIESISSVDQYYNVEDTLQNKIYNALELEFKTTLKVITEDENKYVRNDEPVKNRVTDKVKKYYKEKLKKEQDDSTPLSEFLQRTGTKGHSDIESIIKRYTDEKGYLRIDDAGNLAPTEVKGSLLSPQTFAAYNVLEEYVAELLRNYNTNSPGTRFMTEAVIYNPDEDLAGTLDFIAILPDGSMDILDWKFQKINNDQTDIAWYKQGAYDLQISEYKKILKKYYGVNKFNKTRAIPIETKYRYIPTNKNTKYVFRGIVLGNLDSTKEEHDYLLPVPTTDESTGLIEIDEQLTKLRALYDKLSDTPVVEGRKDIKKEQLNRLFRTIRQLQVKHNFKPMFEYINLLAADADSLIKTYENNYSKIDPKSPTRKELNDFARNILDVSSKFNPFYDLTVRFKDLYKDDKEFAKLLSDASEKVIIKESELNKLLYNFGTKFIGERFDVVGFGVAEVEYKGIPATFLPISKGGTSATTAFYKMTEPIINAISIEQRRRLTDYTEIVDKYKAWANTKGLSGKNMFDILFRKDNGKFNNTLIRIVQEDYRTKFNKAREEKNIEWFKKNIDLDAYYKVVEEKKQEEISRYTDFIFDTDPEINEKEKEKRINEINKKYDTDTDDSPGWGNYLMYQFHTDKWHTKEYKELQKPGNEPALKYFEYILDMNERAAKMGVISPYIKKSFLPFVRKNGLNEKLILGGDIKIGQSFMEGITVQEDDYGYGRRDPLTGKLKYDITVRYDSDFTDGNDYNEVSTNLFKTIQMFNDELIKYEALSEVTESTRLLLEMELSKESLQTNEKGDVVIVKGVPQRIPGNNVNYNFLLQHVMGRLYGIKSDESELNVTIGKIGDNWDKTTNAINEKLGYNLLPTNMSGRLISLPKIISGLNHFFQAKVLNLNFGIILSTYVGGKMQSYINAGTFYDKSDLARAEATVTSVAFNKEKGQALLGLIKTLYPFVQEDARNKYYKVTASKLADTRFITDILMFPYKGSSMLVELPHIVAMLENAIIIDGKVVNVNKYVKAKFTDRYGANRKPTLKLMQEEKERLLKENSLLSKTSIKNNELVVEGVTDEELGNYRSLIRNLSKDFLGSMDPNDVNIANRKLIYKSFLVFKNWIPPLLDKRIGNLRYVPGTDMYEEGRLRSVLKFLSVNIIESAGNLSDIMKGNEKGMAHVERYLEDKRERYFKKTGKQLEITKEEYMDILRENIKNQFYDLMFFMFLAVAITTMAALADDDEMTPEQKGYWNYSRRIARKLYDEINFYYNPLAFTEILNGSIFPGLGILKDVSYFASNLYDETAGRITGDEERVEKAHPLKYGLKFSVLGNNLMLYAAIASPELAKDLGIKVSANPRSGR